ncbi:MAG: transcriptional activator RfaH [Halocynthiibacter sp.]
MNLARSKSGSLAWAVASTHPSREHVALQNLTRQGFTAYCPMVRKRIRHARRVEEVLRPVFPGYVFIQIDVDQTQWRPILSTIGIRTLISFGSKLGLLDVEFVQGLKERECAGAVDMDKRPFAAGQKVQLVGGPMDGVLATVLSVEARDRIVVLMELLKRSVRVSVADHQAILTEAVTESRTIG